MNEDKLKELQERLVLVAVDQSRFSIECNELSDLIKYVRQLEKDKDELSFNSLSVIKKLQAANAELLAALEHIRGNLYHINNKRITDDFRKELKAIAHKALKN